MTETVLPVIAILAATGSSGEVTPNASLIDSLGKGKMRINGEAERPRYAF
jgi:alcohol dehydrogenase class IV